MKVSFSKRMEAYEAGIFSILKDKKEVLQKQGKKLYDMSIGTPDFPPGGYIMEAIAEACKEPDNYKYAIHDRAELLEAVCGHYRRRFGVELKPEEVMSVYGSQEGIAHIGFTLCNPGDIVLVPNPGYPIFKEGAFLSGADIRHYPLHKENGFLPELNKLDKELLEKAKYIIVSYPLNPVCVTAPDECYEKLISIAKKYNIVVIHDNAYSDIIFNGSEGKSFLSYQGAREVGIEFYSLSKSYNMTGARISFVVGNQTIVEQFKKLRSQIDYGIFLPVQHGAAAALNGPQEGVARQREEYAKRNKLLCGGFRNLGWNVPDSEGTMFVWAPIPEQFDNSVDFCTELIEKSGVICTPGSSFGSLGEGYVRFALVLNEDEIKNALKAIEMSGILKQGV